MKSNSFATACALLCVVAAPASAATMELKLVERATSDVVSDHGATGDSVGDVLVFNNEVYDEANKTPLGRDSGFLHPHDHRKGLGVHLDGDALRRDDHRAGHVPRRSGFRPGGDGRHGRVRDWRTAR